jgi:hypothetical protein
MPPEPNNYKDNIAFYDPDRKGIFIHHDQLKDSSFEGIEKAYSFITINSKTVLLKSATGSRYAKGNGSCLP